MKRRDLWALPPLGPRTTCSLRLGIALTPGGHRRPSGGGSAPVPGSSPTTLSASDYPAGAEVMIYHFGTANMTTVTRADGLTGASVVERVENDGARRLIAPGGSNQQPIVDVAPNGLVSLVGDGTAYMEMLDALGMGTGRQAVFAVFKPAIVSDSNGTATLVGIGTGASPAALSRGFGYFGNGQGGGITRSLRHSGENVQSGTDSLNTATLKARTVVGEQTQSMWGVSRQTAETTVTAPGLVGTGNRYLRMGVNESAMNGVTSAPPNTTANGFTLFQASHATKNPAYGFLYELIVISTQHLAAGQDVSFAQAESIRAKQCANWNLNPITTALGLFGDSRVQQSQTTTGLATTNSRYRIMCQAGWPHGDLPTTVRTVTYGAGGTTLAQLATWLADANFTAMMDTQRLRGVGDKNIPLLWWLHNDLGDPQGVLYSTAVGATNPTGRADEIIDLTASLIGKAATNIFNTWSPTEVWVMNPPWSNASGATIAIPWVRSGSAKAFPSAAFAADCQNGNPSRVIRCFDPTTYTATLAKYVRSGSSPNVTYGAFVSNDNNVNLFNANAAGTERNRDESAGTGHANIYWPPIYEDNTHQHGGGAQGMGRAVAAWATAYV